MKRISNKEEFKLIIENSLRFQPVKVRANQDRNYGLDKKTWTVWVCGPGSCDPSLPLAADIWPAGRFSKLEAAEKEADKLNRWLGAFSNEI